MPSTTPKAYTSVAIFFHWVLALLLLLNFCGGLYMANLPKNTPERNDILFYHASMGSLIFMLAVLRLLWRLTHKPAPLPASVARWQVTASHALHWTLYALMLAAPLAGYVHRLAGGHPVSFFGLTTLPVFVDKNENLRLLTDTIHVSLVWLLAILAIGHIGAALKHRFVDKDGVAERMLPDALKRS